MKGGQLMTQFKKTVLFAETFQTLLLTLSVAPFYAMAAPTDLSMQSGPTPHGAAQPAVVASQPVQTIVPPIAQPEKLETSTTTQTTVMPTNSTNDATAVTQSNAVENATTTTNEAATETQPTTNAQPAPVSQSQPPESSSPPDSSTQPAASTTTENLVVPNGTALQSQFIPMSGNAGTPWSSYAAVSFLVLGMAATGLLVVKLKHGKRLTGGKLERQMQVVSTLPLSPKRQLLLVKIKGKEIALASTENGITLLTEIEPDSQNTRQLVDDSGGDDIRRKKVQQRMIREEPSKMIAATAEDSLDDSAMARSEMLMGALKNLREKSMKSKPALRTDAAEAESTGGSSTHTSPMTQEPKQNYQQGTGKAQPTMRQTRAAFPKYLANAFEKEASRPSTQAAADEAGNVTNLIRERLKDLRPLS